MATNHGGDPLGSILGSMGSHWVKKRGQNHENYHAPKFAFSTTPLSSIFCEKWKLRLCRQITVGTPVIGSILGPMGSHWLKKRVKSVKNYHAPKFEFSITPRSLIFCKNGSYGYGAKSQWGPCRVHLGANGVPLGPKNWSEAWKITMPQNSNCGLPRGHRFFPKIGSYGYDAKSRLGPRSVALGANGVRSG